MIELTPIGILVLSVMGAVFLGGVFAVILILLGLLFGDDEAR